MVALTLALVAFLSVFQTLAAPLNRRALACSATASTLGGIILTTRSELGEIDPIDGVVDGAPVFSAEQSLLSAQKVADQIGTALLFGASAPAPPDNATAIILSSLQDAATNMANIVPLVSTSNDTVRLASANKFLAQAINDTQNLNCTTA
ncbi:hypothetical protein FB451DRAFT_107012 [Mycena latifolia]|nr:hypothetical protein FB451DRAFT_107012 [Mycena latifolia]